MTTTKTKQARKPLLKMASKTVANTYRLLRAELGAEKARAWLEGVTEAGNLTFETKAWTNKTKLTVRVDGLLRDEAGWIPSSPKAAKAADISLELVELTAMKASLHPAIAVLAKLLTLEERINLYQAIKLEGASKVNAGVTARAKKAELTGEIITPSLTLLYAFTWAFRTRDLGLPDDYFAKIYYKLEQAGL